MATTSSTTKTKPDNPNLTRSRSLGRKPKPVISSETGANADGSERKTAEKKPIPNYLKPTISSRPDPVKFLKKNNDDNQKLLRRRSFDQPPSSMTSSSTSSYRKSLNTSPARPRDRPAVPREKPVTGPRSTTINGNSRGGLRGSSAVKAPPVALRGLSGVKKSGLSGSNSSKSKKECSETVPKKSSGKEKEITAETSPLAPAHEDEEKIVKVETDVQVSDTREEPQEEDKEQAAQPDVSNEEKETAPVYPVSIEEEKGELATEDKTEDQIEEPKEPETIQETESEEKEEVEKKVDDEENSETVVLDVKETTNVEESKEEEEAEVKEGESESSNVKEGATETKAQVEELPEEGTKKEVSQGKKESPTAYNDVIASKMQENPRKNKVLALAGAFQTVIDYETAASK